MNRTGKIQELEKEENDLNSPAIFVVNVLIPVNRKGKVSVHSFVRSFLTQSDNKLTSHEQHSLMQHRFNLMLLLIENSSIKSHRIERNSNMQRAFLNSDYDNL